MCSASRRIWTCNGACPKPGNDISFSTTVLIRQLHLRVKMADFLQRPFPNEAAIVAHISGESFSAGPDLGADIALAIVRVHGGMTGPAGGEFEIALVEQDGHGVEVRSVGLEAQPRCLQRDGAAAGKGIEHRRELAIAVAQHFFVCLFIPLRVLVQLLPQEPTQDAKEPLPLRILLRLALVLPRRII